MKRTFYGLGLALVLVFFSSCDQHDTTSPDTSGAVPYYQPGAGVDTVNMDNRNTNTTTDTLSKQ